MLKEISKNKKALLAVLTGGIVLIGGCSGKQNIENESSIISSVDSSSNVDDNTIGGDPNTSSNSSDTTSSNVQTDSSTSMDSNNSTDSDTIDDEDYINIDNEPSVYKNITAEDVVKLSRSFAEYLNKFAKLSDEYYVFSEIKPSNAYSSVYLTSIDNVNKEETERLIESDLLNENIKENIVNAFPISNLIRDDASNKMITAYNNEEKVDENDFIDLSLILTNEADIETFKIMRQIMVEAVNNPETREKNYKDLVYYYMMGENIYDDSYDYSKSIFTTDRSSLTVGGDYILRNMAYSIMQINKATKTDNASYNEMLDASLSNYANIMQVFDDKCASMEKDKQYTK